MRVHIEKKHLREFGLLIGFGFPILIGWLIPFFLGHGFRMWTFWIGVPGFILGIVAPNLLFYPYKAWIRIGHVLGWINSKIILGLVFIFILLPIALIMKIFGYDPLSKKKNHGTTYKEIIKKNSIDLTRIF